MIRDINEEAAEQLAEVNAALLEEVVRLQARVEKLEWALLNMIAQAKPHFTDSLKALALRQARAALEGGE